MMRSLFISFLLFTVYSVSGFQFADGTTTVSLSNPKYILYWGHHQCDLSEANGYQGSLSLSPGGFRQMLLHPPSIWDGKDLQRDFTFKIEDQRVAAANYASQLSGLDAALSPKAKFGTTLHLSNLPLGNGITGAVAIQIVNPDDKETIKPARGFWTSNAPFLNNNFLEQVVWGREDITKNADRDFFTVAEFWQTVRQQPYAEWKFSVTPQPLRAGILLQGPEQGTFGLNANLDNDDEYRQMLDKLSNYKHLARAGTTVLLTLQTAERYEELYKKQMILVQDNDPRLLLRRSRDTHSLTIEWRNFNTTLEGLYLATYKNSEEDMVPIDEPISRINAITYTDSTAAMMFGTRPRCLMDGEEMSGLSFRLTVADSTYEWSEDKPFPPAASAIPLSDNVEFELDSFALSGYALPKMNFILHLFPFTADLLVRNDFETLKKAATDRSVALLSLPVVTKDSIDITFNLPKEALVKISLFGPEGLLDHLISKKFTAGQNNVSIGRSQLRFEGKYYVFLNTPFGVLKQEIELK
jgi:hypothetical protein